MARQKKAAKRHFEPQDRYFEAAKQQGFKSRAAFKLKEIDQKYRIFKAGQTVIDMGAAPGGWSQVALAAVGPRGAVLGVDLEPIHGITAAGFRSLQADLSDEATRTSIRETIGQADVVLSDLAPSTSGIKLHDQLKSAALVRQALAVAQSILKPGGHFVAKIFPSEEAAHIKKELKDGFQQVYEFTPQASRRTSHEIYFVALKYQRTE